MNLQLIHDSTLRITALAILILGSAGAPQEEINHPILTTLKDSILIVPKGREEFPTTVTILGTTCSGTEMTYASVGSVRGPSQFDFEYNKDVIIEGKNNPDACDELDVPSIDVKFDLTFKPSTDKHEIGFTGRIQPDCKDCKPKRVKTISGTLRKLSTKKYRISFIGDLSDTVDLETD
jgi:hypothetical protein